MTDVTIPPDFNTQFTTYQSNTRWIIPESVTGTFASGPVFVASISYTGTEVDLAGHLVSSATYSGIFAAASGTVVNIAKTGTIDGYDGVVLDNLAQEVTNAGTITVSNFGLYYYEGSHVVNNGKVYTDFIGIAGLSDGATIENNGLLKGANGIYIGGTDIHIQLGSNSRIIGTGDDPRGIWAETSAGDSYTVKNAGLIQSNIVGGAGDCRITNTGKIVGDVNLGDGNDYFDTSHGVLDGKVVGGIGNDTFVISSGLTLINEGVFEGTDTVKSSASISFVSNIFKGQELENLILIGKSAINGTGNELANEITGNKANNHLSGGAKGDTLAGGHGDDFLKGGTGNDTFVFKGGDGHDIVQDLRDGDVVNIVNWVGIDNFLDVLKHAHNDGNDVIISSGNDTLTIRGMHEADLNQTSFDIS